MYQQFCSLVLPWLKVPPEPHPPAGAPSSLRVFRAGKNYLNLRLVGWAIPQLAAFAGIVFWTVLLVQVEQGADTQRQARAMTPAPRAPAPDLTPGAPSAAKAPAPKGARPKVRLGGWTAFRQGLVDVALRLPAWSFPLLWVFKIGGVLLYLAQIPFTYALRRLDYEMRWYVVTDRSLRIRTGVWNVQELTMSFANLQQVSVSQNPVQRLLGLSDVCVQTAGGGGGEARAGQRPDSLHTAEFHSVENGAEIRDLILERLRRFRAAGLGDPEDHRHETGHPPAGPAVTAAAHVDADALAAARELLAEARALRQALAR